MIKRYKHTRQLLNILPYPFRVNRGQKDWYGTLYYEDDEFRLKMKDTVLVGFTTWDIGHVDGLRSDSVTPVVYLR